MYSILNFGKHKGKSLSEVILHDPDWFFWAIENHVLDKKPRLAAEARDLNFKARNIKIPKPDTEYWRVNYLFDHRDKFYGFNLVRVSSAAEAHPDRLDLSVVYRQKHYDKQGNRFLLRNFKDCYFGYGHGKITKTQCEEFFGNAANFYKPTKRRISQFIPRPEKWPRNAELFKNGTILEENHHASN